MLISVWGWRVVGGQSLRWQPFLHFQLASNVNHIPGFSEGITGSGSLSLVSFALHGKSFCMWVAFGIVNDSALLLFTVTTSLQLSSVWQKETERERERQRQRASRALQSSQGPRNKKTGIHLLVCWVIGPCT